MSTQGAKITTPAVRGPIQQVLEPIRHPLLFAALLAAAGAMLTLVPLGGIARVAAILLGVGIHASTDARNEILKVIVFSVSCMFAGMALVSIGELIAHLADRRLVQRLRQDLTQRLSRVPLGWFTNRSSGEVKRALQDDIATLHSLSAHFYTSVGRALGAILIAVIYLFALDWRMALIALLPFSGFFMFLRRATKRSEATMSMFVDGLTRIHAAMAGFVNGMPVIKAFGSTGRAHAAYRDAIEGFAAAFADFTRPLVGPMAHAHALIAPVTVLGVVLAAGMLFVEQGWMAPVDLLPFALVAPGICAPLLLLHTLLHDLGNAEGAAQRVLALMKTPVLPVPAPGRQYLPGGHRVCFDDVSYSYGAGQPGLSRIAFTLEPGTVTAIVGPSGAGKSTIARLLLRFFDPDEGSITLGGADLRNIASAELYRRIGFVLQEVRLIHASVRDNIALGRPSTSQHEVEAAARAAHIHERILALPRGYDAVIGEDARLSGGERQRLGIARAVLLDAPVLVLDEPTASADAGHEAAIQSALSHFARGRTVLVIAHRLDTVMHADRIIVLDGGAIVQQGMHDELLACGGLYARLWACEHGDPGALVAGAANIEPAAC